MPATAGRTNEAGFDDLHQKINDYFDRCIERLILGRRVWWPGEPIEPDGFGFVPAGPVEWPMARSGIPPHPFEPARPAG